MIKIEKTVDKELIESFLFDREMYDVFVNDGSLLKGKEDYAKWEMDIFVVYWKKFLAAIFFVYPISKKVGGVHVGIKKEFRGKMGYDIGKEAIKYCFKNIGLDLLLARIAKTNRKCIFFAKELGMKIFGENEIYKFLEVTKNG